MALDHCAINVCLYGGGRSRWTMTERSSRHVQRDATHFAVGPSQLRWDGQALTIEIDERTAPWPRRVLGQVRVHPLGLSRFNAALDAQARHRWGPIAPCARVEVDLPLPGLRWSGPAYLDSNEGDEPIENAFLEWDWMRTWLPDGRCAVVYDARGRQGDQRLLALRFAPDGRSDEMPPPARRPLPATRWWRIARAAHAEPAGGPPRVVQTFEDTPFYARSLLRLSLEGTEVDAMHETLDLRRLTSPVVQRMLPFRMPRVA